MAIKNEIAEKIIIALDVDSGEKALSLVRQLEEAAVFKVGLRLFTAEGPPLLRELQNLGKKIFLDLKLHDIPNTVADAVKVGVIHRVHMMTLHASGGKEMMVRAAEAASEEAQKQNTPRPLLLAVTILTSLKDENIAEIGMIEDTRSQVVRLAGLAEKAGMDAIVCSPQEIDLIREKIGQNLRIVTPGIRPQWAAANDQKRIMTPQLAVQKGVDYLVIGRPIIASPSPRDAFLKILKEVEQSVDPAAGNRADSKNGAEDY
jgi:orotidine-5'-phosphate decarboxylase